MIDPTLDDLGRKVIYRDWSGKTAEGTITSFNMYYVFVRYDNGSTSAATERHDLSWPRQAALK